MSDAMEAELAALRDKFEPARQRGLELAPLRLREASLQFNRLAYARQRREIKNRYLNIENDEDLKL